MTVIKIHYEVSGIDEDGEAVMLSTQDINTAISWLKSMDNAQLNQLITPIEIEKGITTERKAYVSFSLEVVDLL